MGAHWGGHASRTLDKGIVELLTPLRNFRIAEGPQIYKAHVIDTRTDHERNYVFDNVSAGNKC